MPSYYPVVLDAANLRLKETGIGDTVNTSGSILQTDLLKIDGPVIQSMNTVNTSSNTINIAYSSYFKLNLTGNYTIASIEGANASANVSQTILIEINNAGGYSLLWPANVKWNNGITPTIYDDAFSIITLTTVDNGTTFRGVQSIVTST